MSWADGFSLARRFWWVIPALIAAIVAFNAASAVFDIFDGPSGREVAATVREREAKADTRTAEAETGQRESAIVRIEQAHERVAHITQQSQRARHAIQSAPDLDAALAEHGAHVGRVRDEAARDRAAALSDYRSAIDP